MSIMNQTDNVARQYADGKNLSVRSQFHAKYSTNQRGFAPWLWEQYRFCAGDSILELGCGNGWQWDGRIERLPQGCKLVLSDFSQGMVDAAREKLSPASAKIEFRRIDIQAIPCEDESFDAVIANHMLYHVPDLDAAFSEVRRALRPGGRFYAATNGNGGMSLFLHEALKKLDPKTEAFSQTFSFSLQNGEALLGRYFSSVERADYEDSLAVTETGDLIEWIDSSMSISGYTGAYSDALYDYFEAIRARDGAICIPKEVGLFICAL